MKKNICYFLLFFISISTYAQNRYTSLVPKAIRSYESATKFYDSGLNDKALTAIEESIEADPNFIEAHMLMANIYSDLKQREKSISSYKKAIDINPDFFPKIYFSLAKEEFNSGKYEDAIKHFEKFISYPKVNGSLLWKSKQMIESSYFASDAMNNPVPFDVKNMGDSINSNHDEYFPTITADGNTFLFTRKIKTYLYGQLKSKQEDLFISNLKNNEWGIAEPISELNTPGNEGASALSSDGQYLFLSACNDEVEVEGAYKTLGSCDIFLSKKKGKIFANPRNLNEPINSSLKESMPSFSSDGRTLYFVRRQKVLNSIGQYDIMVSQIGNNSNWSEPVSVSDLINTQDDETSVFIHPDDQTLYFSSNGHPGMGGKDIYMSRKDSMGKWQKPVNLGYPINTINDEGSFLVSPDGKTAYFSSDRDGGFGGKDIYQFSLYEKVQPIPVTYMKGKVFNYETNNILEASFELIDLSTGKTVVSSTSNATTGDFIVALPTGKSYALNVSKDGYLFYSENFQLKSVKSAKDPFLKNVPLKLIKVGQSIVLNNIFYDTDKYDLKNESRIELGKLISFLEKNPKIKFEISGHTDSIGTKQYNQVLSEKRARSVFDYLLVKGVAINRMSSKGYGDSMPVSKNNTEEGRSKNRRTEFTVTAVE